MALMRETPRSLAIFFVFSGLLSLVLNLGAARVLGDVAKRDVGLNAHLTVLQYAVYLGIGVSLTTPGQWNPVSQNRCFSAVACSLCVDGLLLFKCAHDRVAIAGNHL